jgi:hypothetical protein
MYDVYSAICEVCKKGPKDHVALYRTGPKGIGNNPHWRCSEDRAKEIAAIDEVLKINNKGIHHVI